MKIFLILKMNFCKNYKMIFRVQLEGLVNFVKKSILPKQIGNFYLDGKDLFGLIQSTFKYLF